MVEPGLETPIQSLTGTWRTPSITPVDAAN